MSGLGLNFPPCIAVIFPGPHIQEKYNLFLHHFIFQAVCHKSSLLHNDHWTTPQHFPSARGVLLWVPMKTSWNWFNTETFALGRALVSGEMERHWEMRWERKRSLGKWSSFSTPCLLNGSNPPPFFFLNQPQDGVETKYQTQILAGSDWSKKWSTSQVFGQKKRERELMHSFQHPYVSCPVNFQYNIF